MKFRIPLTLSALAAVLLLHFCGPKPHHGFVDDTPDEITRLVHKHYRESVWAVGTAEGPTESVARNRAVMQARAEIARRIETQVDALQKAYEESVDHKSAREYSEVMKTFATVTLQGSHIAKSLIRRNKRSCKAKVLVVLTAEQIKNEVDARLESYTSFKASEAYKELEERVARERQLRRR
jgi:hypothetical protein